MDTASPDSPHDASGRLIRTLVDAATQADTANGGRQIAEEARLVNTPTAMNVKGAPRVAAAPQWTKG